VLNGKVVPGSTVAIVGAGPIGLAALLTARFYSPAQIILIDLDDRRLEVARRLGATQTINSADGKAAETVKTLTAGRGVDTAIEAVGVPGLAGLRAERDTVFSLARSQSLSDASARKLVRELDLLEARLT